MIIAQSMFLLEIRRSESSSVKEITDFYYEVKLDEIDLLRFELEAISKKFLCRLVGLSSLHISMRNGLEKCKSHHDALLADSCLSLLPLFMRNEKMVERVNIGNSKAQICYKEERYKFCRILLKILNSSSRLNGQHLNYFSLDMTAMVCICTVLSPVEDTFIITKDMIYYFQDLLSLYSFALSDAAECNTNRMIEVSSHFLARKVLYISLYTIHILIAQTLWQNDGGKLNFSNFTKEALFCLKRQLSSVADVVCESERISSMRESQFIASQDLIGCFSETSADQTISQEKVDFDNSHTEFQCLCSLSCKNMTFESFQQPSPFVNSSESFMLDMLTLTNTCLSSVFLRKLMAKTSWSHDLLSLAGVLVDSSPRRFRVPLAIRKKLLRLLKKFIYLEEPNAEAIEGLLAISYNTDSDSFFLSSSTCDLSSISVSLLRSLCIKSEIWNKAILQVIGLTLASNQQSQIKLGAYSFLGGNLNVLSSGCHVLVNSGTLKTKSTGLGDRVDSIIRSFRHRTCPAGVVSHIDSKNHSCEVILFDDRQQLSLPENAFPIVDTSSITVRAITVNLDDVVIISETPVIMGIDHFNLFKDLEEGIQNIKISLEGSQASVEIFMSISRVLILRGLVALLSSNDIPTNSLNTGLQDILDIATIDSDESYIPMSSIAICEQKVCEILSQLSDIERHKSAIECYPPTFATLESLMKVPVNKISESDNNVAEVGSADGDGSISTTETNNDHQQPSHDDVQAAIAQMAELGLPR